MLCVSAFRARVNPGRIPGCEDQGRCRWLNARDLRLKRRLWHRYELREGDEVVAIGYVNCEQPLEVGDRLEVGGQHAIVRAIEAPLCESELRLVLRLPRAGS
jgi:hypothetical protein